MINRCVHWATQKERIDNWEYYPLHPNNPSEDVLPFHEGTSVDDPSDSEETQLEADLEEATMESMRQLSLEAQEDMHHRPQ